VQREPKAGFRIDKDIDLVNRIIPANPILQAFRE